jgi:hypothetical protein
VVPRVRTELRQQERRRAVDCVRGGDLIVGPRLINPNVIDRPSTAWDLEKPDKASGIVPTVVQRESHHVNRAR